MFNTKDSVLVRNYRNNVCMTMAGVDELSKNQLFTMQRIGIKVHQTAVGSLNVEIIKTILPYNNM